MLIRDVRNDDDIVFLEPLEKESQNVVCAVKLLVILALRFGNVHGTTLQEVLVHTSKRVDRTVQWTHPNRPVLCQMPRGNSMLTLDTPAPSTQLGRSLKEMALVGGVIDPVTSHDIRRGAMRDTAHLNRTVAGVESACAALVGGHTKMSENRGITRAYIGALQAPIYNIRAEKPFVDRLAPKATESTFTPRRNTTAEIDAYMDDHGMDKKDSMKRSTASYQLREAQVRKWRESQQDRQVLAPESKNSPTIANKAAAGKGRTLLPVSTNIGRVVTHAMEKPFPEQPRLPEKQETQKYFSNEVPIDPRLLNWDDNDADVEPAALDALESLIFSNLDEDRATSDKDNGLESTPEHHTTDAIEDCLIDAHLQERTPQAETDLSFWNCQADLFVNRLAAINIFKLSSSFKQNDPLEAAKRVASGNSRDHPTPFLIYCGVGECDYSSWSLAAVEKHQINCTGAQPSEKYFSCIEDGCSLSFTTPGSLKSHINTAHTFTPRPCARCPDQPDVLYQDIKSWKRHQAELHDKFDEPVYCPLKDHGCNNKQTAYTGFSAIKNHLQNVHKQNAEQIRAFFPAKQPVRLPEATFDCPLPVCTENLNVNCNRDLRLHLKRKHGQTDEQTLELVPLSKAEKSKQLNRAAKADEPKIAKTVWECPDDDCSSTRAFPANRRQKIGR